MIAAQLVHAAGETGGDLPPGTRAVVLAVEDEAALVRLAERLERQRVPHRAIREPDAPYSGALMALGVVPGPRHERSKHFSQLPLLR